MKELRTIPWLTTKAIQFLDEWLKRTPEAKALEFGCGGSTIWLSERVESLVSVEHNVKWYSRIKEHVENVDLRRMDRPYANVVRGFPNEHFDLVLIDGRDRVECAKACWKKLKKKGLLMLDNAERARYILRYTSCLGVGISTEQYKEVKMSQVFGMRIGRLVGGLDLRRVYGGEL